MAVETLQATLEAQKAAKFDTALEHTVRQWIASVLGEPVSTASFHDFLKDGTVLCRLLNALVPGVKVKYNQSSLAFKQLENISNYLTVCDSWLGSDRSFRSTDLYEARDLNPVLANLGALRQLALKHGADLPAFVTSKSSGDAKKLSSGTASSANLTAAAAASSSSSSSSSSTTTPSSPSSSALLSLANTKSEVSSLEDDVRTKAEFKFNVEHADNLLKWMEGVLEQPIAGERDFHAALKSGVVLCDLINKISPRAIPTVHRTALAFKQMENISTYLRACRDTLHMKDEELFETNDLFQKKNLSGVANHLDILARLAVTLPGNEHLPRLQTTQSLSLWSASLKTEADFLADDAAPAPAAGAEEKELVRWVNRQMAAEPGYRPIVNLSTELRTGVAIIRLLEKLTSNSCGFYEARPSTLGHCISNASLVIRFLSAQLFEQVEFITATDIVQARTEALVRFVAWAREKFDLEYAFLSLLGRSAEDDADVPTSQTPLPPVVSPAASSAPASSSSSVSPPLPRLSPRQSSSSAVPAQTAELERDYQNLSNLVFNLQHTAAELEQQVSQYDARLAQLTESIEARTKSWAAEQTAHEAELQRRAAEREAQLLANTARHQKAVEQLEAQKNSLLATLDSRQQERQSVEMSLVTLRLEIQTLERQRHEAAQSAAAPLAVDQLAPTAADAGSRSPSSKRRDKSSSKADGDGKKRHSRSSKSSSSSSSSAPSVVKSSSSSSKSSSKRASVEQEEQVLAADIEKRKAALEEQFMQMLEQAKTAHEARMAELLQERQRADEEAQRAQSAARAELEQIRQQIANERQLLEGEKAKRKQWEDDWAQLQQQRQAREEAWQKQDAQRLSNIRAFARKDVASKSTLLQQRSGQADSAPTPAPAPAATPTPAKVNETPEVLAAQTAIRKRIAEEILSTERSYLSSLKTVVRGLLQPLAAILTASEHGQFFATLSEIADYHGAVLRQLEALVSNWSDTSCVAGVFLNFNVTAYVAYVRTNPYVPCLLRLFRAKYPAFAAAVKSFEAAQKSRLDTESLMIMPVQRLPRYVLLLREMRKYSSTTASPKSCQDLDAALHSLQASLDKVNKGIDKSVSSTVQTMGAIVDTFEAPPGVDLHQAVISTNGRSLLVGCSPLLFKKQDAGGRPKSAIITARTAPNAAVVPPKKKTELHGWLFSDLVVLAEKIAEPVQPKSWRLVQIVTIGDFTAVFQDAKRPAIFGIEFCSVRWIFQATPDVRSEWIKGLTQLKENQQNQLFSLK